MICKKNPVFTGRTASSHSQYPLRYPALYFAAITSSNTRPETRDTGDKAAGYQILCLFWYFTDSFLHGRFKHNRSVIVAVQGSDVAHPLYIHLAGHRPKLLRHKPCSLAYMQPRVLQRSQTQQSAELKRTAAAETGMRYFQIRESDVILN
jgi:hypothetical protein